MARALMTAEHLATLLAGDRPPLLLDVRWELSGADPDTYRRGHLPGAVFCDLDTELADPPGVGGRHPLPDPARLRAAAERWGLAPGRPVVAYDGGHGAGAARAWWVLRWAGHPDVRVLDGGLPAWVAAGGTLEAGEVVPEPAPDAVVRPGSMPTVTAEDVLAGRAGRLLDARSPERFRGESEPVDPVAGRIPGAVSCPVPAVLAADGHYLPAPALADALGLRSRTARTDDGAPGPDAPAGAPGRPDDDVRVTAYCGSGVTAAQLVLAAHEAGVDVALYPGSWSGWIVDPARPVETGP